MLSIAPFQRAVLQTCSQLLLFANAQHALLMLSLHHGIKTCRVCSGGLLGRHLNAHGEIHHALAYAVYRACFWLHMIPGSSFRSAASCTCATGSLV
jgi:hypothetical protein